MASNTCAPLDEIAFPFFYIGVFLESDLFREEVLDSHSRQAYGEVILAHPVSHFVLAALALGLLFLAGLFLAFGQYTKRATVPGVLEPVGGLVKMYASRPGRLKSPQIREGQTVHKDDVLLVFTSEHDSANGKAVEAQSEAYTLARLDTLHKELAETLGISQSDDASARESLAALRSAHDNLIAQIKNQTARVLAAQGVVARYEELQKSGFMPEVQVQDKRNDLTDQQVRLQAMQKDLIANDADIARATRNIASAPMRTAVAKAQIERNIASAEAELGIQQNVHDWSVTAPCDGVVSGLSVNPGQSVETNTPLLTLVPSESTLQATLYASSRDLGFIKIGQIVKIKLDAFPYQKFGLATGKVVTVANSPVLPNEISPTTRLLAASDKAEPLYAINVALDKQTVDAYGQPQALRPGMQLGADVELDMRRLYEWILEPLYSMKQG